MLLQSVCGYRYTNIYQQITNKKPYDNCHTSNKNISFMGTTTAGKPIRKLKNVPDAYFGGITIDGDHLEKIKQNLVKCTTVKKAVQYLDKYKPNMLRVEKSMLERFKEVAFESSRKTFPDLLQMWYKDALMNLKIEEFAVIDMIDRIALELSPETTLAVWKETTDCRKIILDEDPNRRFKRKTVLEALGKIKPKRGEEKIMESLMESASYLPTSATSENAFIIKYADRSHNEICNRLITPSLLSIDHIFAASKGGPNDMSNFVGSSAGANVIKQDMWFKKFVRRFPEVITNCQKYIEFFINIINNGGFKGNQAYPYKIRERMIQESDGKVKLDLSSLKYTEDEALELEKASNRRDKRLDKVNE